MTRRSSLIISTLCLATVISTCPSMPASAVAEELRIELSKGARDPLIELVAPPQGSADRVQFTSSGLRIRQTTDVRSRPTGVTGFKTLVSAGGDFRAELSLLIHRLDPPNTDWGHGLIFLVHLDDAQKSVLKLNQVALCPNGKPMTAVEFGQLNKTVHYWSSPKAIKQGELVIARKSNQAILSLIDGGQETIVDSFLCPTADIRSIEVWSTRVAKGNAPADILIKSLNIHADSFYAFQPTKKSTGLWWYVLIAAQVLICISLAAWALKKPRA